MESIVLLALTGAASTAALGLLSIFKRWRPYSLSVLVTSAVIALALARELAEAQTNVLEIYLTCFFIMLCAQVFLAPLAIVAFCVKNRIRNA